MYLYLKAVYAKGQNRYDEALKWARKALQTYPEDPEIMVLLAGILFAGPETGHEEASALCLEARKLFENVQSAPPGPIAAGPIPAGAGLPPLSPLKTAMREEAKSEADRFLMLEAYNHQDWYKAATMLEDSSPTGLDKAVIATILRKSGRTREAIAFSSEWYKEAPQEESAVEAYLRSLAASSTGIGVASAATSGVSDASSGLLGLAAGYSQGGLGPSLESGQVPLVGLVLKLLSGSCSKGMLSYLYYLRGTLQADPDAAIDSYRLALLERGDNVEALACARQGLFTQERCAKSAFLYQTSPIDRDRRHGSRRRAQGAGSFDIPGMTAPFRSEIAEFLENIYRECNRMGRLDRDPLALVRRYDDVADREVAGLLCSTLAFGSVDLILRACNHVLEPLGAHPAAMLETMGNGDLLRFWGDFQYRFCFPSDIQALLRGIRAARREWGSLEGLFLDGDAPGRPMTAATGAFVRALRVLGSTSEADSPHSEPSSTPIRKNLLPDPSDGSGVQASIPFFALDGPQR